MQRRGARRNNSQNGFSLVRLSIIALTVAPVLIILATILRAPPTPVTGVQSATYSNERTERESPMAYARHSIASSQALPTGNYNPENILRTNLFQNISDNWERKRLQIGSEPMNGDWMLDCPTTPPADYPPQYPIMDLITNWPPDRPLPVAPKHFNGLCRFDFQRDYDKAMNYRDAEVPFIIYNHPGGDEVARKWSSPGYLEKLLGSQKYRTETSHNNHFMYHSGGAKRTGNKPWRAPTSSEQLSYSEFKKVAQACEANNCSEHEKHFYFRVTGMNTNHFIFKELPFYYPKKGLFFREPKGQRGIHCRFGMSAVIAENHWDGSRNLIGNFGGRRRYILSHPKECDNMYLYPLGHPSARHSGDACNYHPDCKDSPTSVDYSHPDLKRFPKFEKLLANEIVMAPGEFMYLPTHWFHYIISLGLNYQCNTRSGRGTEYSKHMRRCGFS